MSSVKPVDIYQELLESNLNLQRRFLSHGRIYVFARFSTFLLAIGLVVAAFTLGPFWWWPASVLLVSFIVLVIFHERLIRKQKFNDSCIDATRHELEAMKGHYTSFDGGNEFSNPAHSYSTDLDIFGGNSIFQAINRTETFAGKARLSRWFLEPLVMADPIYSRQEAVKDLASRPDWRIRLRAHGMVADEGKQDLELLFEWLSSAPLFKSKLFGLAQIVIPVASLSMTALLIADVITMQMFLLYLVLPLAITGFHTKAINGRHVMLSKKVELLEKYAIRFRMIENEEFSSGFMSGLVNRLKSGTLPASKIIRKLGRITASLDTRLNLLAGFIMNIYLLWDIRQISRLESWQSANKENLPDWFDVLSETEAIASMGAFAYANPDYIFPEIISDKFAINAVETGHPLIPSAQRINNDIAVTHRGHFNIVTGANMAGKSTYLRTVGVNMVLALAGAPVCAKSFACYPAPVFTSLRTTDSLSTNQSYFYAELLRLKELIDRLSRGEELFILLDEILKGTNSVDKQAGSKALLTQLIGLGAAGFIATHDLELGSLSKIFPAEVTNYHFEAEIAGDELHFDYKLKPGIAQNMNATFLMKKMGITI